MSLRIIPKNLCLKVEQIFDLMIKISFLVERELGIVVNLIVLTTNKIPW